MPPEPALSIRALRVVLPDGRLLLDGVDLDVSNGEVVVVLGGSGAGKSTLTRAVFDPEGLRRQGFAVELDGPPADRGRLGLIPQRGALFDHLDVAGNIAIALRSREGGDESGRDRPADWLAAVDLPPELARRGTRVSRLSGGQAQRLAVARTLASGREILFLDEPTVGLDAQRVLELAALVRERASAGSAVVVVTHDLQFACHVAHRLLFLDPARRTLVPLVAGWSGPLDEGTAAEAAARRRAEVERAALALLRQPTTAPARAAPRRSLRRAASAVEALLGPLALPVGALAAVPALFGRLGRDLLRVCGRVLIAAVARPAPFYAVVSLLLGYTILYVIERAMPTGVRAERAVELVGGSYIVALTPPICAFLFVATSGSAISAWFGGMSLTRQIDALEALGISRRRYLWLPGWACLTLAFLLVAALFGLGMTAGGALRCWQTGTANALALLLGDIIDPEPERAMLRVRAGWLVIAYAGGIAADVVYRATRRKERADDVTRAMTGSIVSCTLWVVALELLSATLVFPR